MQGIYTYVPEKNYVRREYSVAAILLLVFMVLISLVPVFNLLYFYISTFRSMCAVSNMAVFCSFLTSILLLLLLLLNYMKRSFGNVDGERTFCGLLKKNTLCIVWVNSEIVAK